jgi:type I restriction enzyme S subunit
MTRAVRLRHVAEVNPATPEFDHIPDDAPVTFLPLEAIWPGSLDTSRVRSKGEVASGYTRFRVGDILVPKITPTFQASRTVIAIGLRDGIGAGTTELHIVRPGPRVDPRYLVYTLSSQPFLQEGEASMNGVAGQKRVPDDFVRNLPVLLRPVNEQRAIAGYLDTETARVAALIAARQKLTQLAAERRSLHIRDVVLGGSGSRRQREVDGKWFGTIPANWEVKPLKALTGFVNGCAFKPEEWGDEGTPIIRIVNLNGGGDFNYTVRQVDRKYLVEEGDLLFGWSGNRGTSFGPFRWRLLGPHLLNQHIFRLTAPKVDRDWLYWVLIAATPYVEELAHGIIGMVHITQDRLAGVPIPVAPVEEQRLMAQQLDREAVLDGQLGELADRQMDLLRERRQALITAAVAGQLEIPGVTA